MDLKNLSIDKIELSTRSRNALHREEIHTVAEMMQCTRESLSEMRYLGEKSIEEILAKIDEYKNMVDEPKDIRLEEIEGLSTKTYNVLLFAGLEYLSEVISLTEDELKKIPRMDLVVMDEIMRLIEEYPNGMTVRKSVFELINVPEYADAIFKYVKINDVKLENMGLSTRPYNRLLASGYLYLSDIIFLTRSDLKKIPAMGPGSIEEIIAKKNEFLESNEERIMAMLSGDMSAVMDDAALEEYVLELFQNIGFKGLNLKDIEEKLDLPITITEEKLKSVIGKLLAEKKLEYVDYRCYRVYGVFEEYLDVCEKISDRGRDFIRRRLKGDTLELIAQDNGIVRERVRQVVKKEIERFRHWYVTSTGMKFFDEDYYRYFYANYSFDKKDAEEWFGISSHVWRYLELIDVKQGKKDLQTALEDVKGLDLGLRLKVKNYLNRNKIYVDGTWVNKKRIDIETVVVKKFCKENVSFEEFVNIYNNFLKEEIAFDESIYITDDVIRTRKNILGESRILLWKLNEQIRYYDIDGQDYTELLDTLNLESYENTGLSTEKWMREYPDVMKKYDIRDKYELHNLLRKIVLEGSYNDFHCKRMPDIEFGHFDRDEALLEIMMDNAPISVNDLADLIHEEYGYDQGVTIATYLASFGEYYHQGMYTVDQKLMSYENKMLLSKALTEDFYYMEEVRKIYKRLIPGANEEEVNPYNLKLMGFQVYSRYVLQNHASLEAFFQDIFTKEDTIDISEYKRRFAYIQMYYMKFRELKESLQIIEYEPNQIINIRKLEANGVTYEILKQFCDEVYAFVEDGSYFSAESIRQTGFESELYDLGFSDWFYANVLISDKRFSYSNMLGNLVFYKGNENITIKSFATYLIYKYGSVDVYDLITELTEKYGCVITDKWDIIYRVQGTNVYYDKILDRLYANEELYYRELEEGDFGV